MKLSKMCTLFKAQRIGYVCSVSAEERDEHSDEDQPLF